MLCTMLMRGVFWLSISPYILKRMMSSADVEQSRCKNYNQGQCTKCTSDSWSDGLSVVSQMRVLNWWT